MGSTHAKILSLLRERNHISDQLQELQAEVTVPGLSPIGRTLMWVIIGLLEENGKPPTLTEVMPLVSYGSQPRSFYHHIPKLKRLGLIQLRNTGTSEALIYPREKACRLFQVPHSHVFPALNPTAEKALLFIRSYVADHGIFPTHAEINAILKKQHRVASGLLNTLAKNKFIKRANGKWTLLVAD
jgi:DNA-binding transcriptional ArsR family regulator